MAVYKNNLSFYALTICLLAGATCLSNGFSTPISYTASPIRSSIPFVTLSQRRVTNIRMTEEENGEKSEDENASASENEDDNTEEEETEVKEDPELTALKEEIAELEKELKEKRVKASRTEDIADDYSEKGYQRKCAEMENMRRTNINVSSEMKTVAKANVIQSFLPNLEYLNTLSNELKDDDFARSYDALGKEFENTLKSMDLLSFTYETGEIVDEKRCAIVNEIYNEENVKGTVLDVTSLGYEVNGQIIRKADVTVSLGSEADAAKDNDTNEDETTTENTSD